ncbi:MAG: 50S ribosomal protein L30 [Candidatus Bathyarchaeia archaeon]
MSEETAQRKPLVAVRIRGVVSARAEVRETLKMLHLTRNNHAVLIDDRPSFLGMLKAAQNYITWGEVSEETLKILLNKRARLAGNKKLSEEYLKKIGYESVDKLAEAVYKGAVEYWKLPNIQPVFKLHPPSKGFKKSIKKGYKYYGELGYRGEKINELIKRMA